MPSSDDKGDAKQVSFSSQPETPPNFELALDAFYQWIVRWRRGLSERKVMLEEFHQTTSANFSWCDAAGNLLSSSPPSSTTSTNTASFHNFNGRMVYGSGATYLQLTVELKDVTLLQSHHPFKSLVSAQVWETVVRDNDNNKEQHEEQVSAKQVTAWMEKQPDTGWRLLHLHETYIEGHESTLSSNNNNSKPPEPIPEAPWKTSTTVASRRRHIATEHVLEQCKAKPLLSWNGNLVGISIAGWDIGASQGPIGDQLWFQQALELLEPVAQYKLPNTNDKNNRPRQLVLPEMVFPLAHVVLERRQRGDLFVSWDAMDALKEWSEAHQAIPLPDSNSTTTSTNTAEPGTPVSFRGVSVLQSSDATLWKRKQQQTPQPDQESSATATTAVVVGSTTFHYDWTYSTPFIGKFYGTHARRRWNYLETSGMPMHLLTDQSVPILYFDHILLYEDDLHDNGQVEYTVKVRVMPTCAYLLSKLFVRVDHVLLRVRECRLLVDFANQMLYRDVTWRECQWAELASHQLPTDVRAWTTQEEHKETPAFAYLLSKLPLVTALPRDLMKHAEFSYGPTNVTTKPQRERTTATANQP